MTHWLVKEHVCIGGWVNAVNSDNAVSIQKMVTPNMLGRNTVRGESIIDFVRQLRHSDARGWVGQDL